MGLANQAVTPGRTSLLEAVNVCLAVIGEAPVNTLETQQVGEAAQAERTLLEYHKEGQTRGWGWNRERAVSFYPDATSRELLIPASVVKWAPSRLDWNNRFQARGSRVYDTEERSYAIPEPIASIEADIVSLLPWDDCPEVFNRWATIRAARVFSNRAVGNTTTYQLTQSDEDQAWADLLRVDTEQSQPNAITGEAAWATFRPAMGLGRRRGGSGSWGSSGSDGSGLSDFGGSSGSSVTLPQALGQDASPTFAGLTLSAFSTFSGQLCVLGTNGAVNPLPLGSGLSIVGGALVATGGGGGGGGSGTVTSVGLSVPTGFSITGSPVTTSGTLVFSIAAGYSLPTTASQTNWDSAYSERLRWDGGSLGLTPATGRTSLGLGGSAVLGVGTTTGTVAAGDDSRITGALSAATAVSTYQPFASNLTSLGAQAPSYYLNRANQTGTQAASTITGLKDQIGIACSDVTSNLTASTSVAKETLRMPYAMTLTQVRLNVGTAPTGSALIVNIKQGGTSIFSTRPQIDATAKTSVGSGTAAVIATTALTDDAEITIFVEQIGGTIAGSGLKVWLIGTRA